MHASGFTRLALWCLPLLVIVACESADAGGGGGRGGSNAGRGGSVSDAGPDASRDAGTSDAAVGGRGGEGGKGGSGGMVSGGTGGSDADDADSGAEDSGAAGSGGAGSGGTGGAAGGDPDYDQCLSDAEEAGQDVNDCARCLCQADKCRSELNTATQDAKSNAVVICSQVNGCTDVCCLCGESSCDISNYGSGPCAPEVKVAAGVGAGSGIEAALTVSSKCARNATDDNSCHKVTVLSDCQLAKCADACPSATTCSEP
jgi:hypothetical protein